MLRQSRLWMLGVLSLIGVSMATYAYANSCGDVPVEFFDMQIISVTHDGMMVDPPEYAREKGTLQVAGKKRFFKSFWADSRYFYAE